MESEMKRTDDSSLHGSATGEVSASAEKMYFLSVGKQRMMSPKEEEECARRFRATGDRRFSDMLAQANQRFVVRTALNYRYYGFPILDLIQEGNVGLLIAIEKYEPDKGCRLISYAIWWIKAKIQEYILRNWSLVMVGTTQRQRRLFTTLMSSRKRVQAELEADRNGLSLSVVLAQKVGMPVAEVDDTVRRIRAHDASLDTPVGDSDERTGVDFLASDHTVESECANKEFGQMAGHAVQEAIQQLDEREAEIIQARHLDYPRLTLRDLSEKLGISKERVRQLEARALGKLRQILSDSRFVREEFGFVDVDKEQRGYGMSDSSGYSRVPLKVRTAALYSALPGTTLEEKSGASVELILRCADLNQTQMTLIAHKLQVLGVVAISWKKGRSRTGLVFGGLIWHKDPKVAWPDSKVPPVTIAPIVSGTLISGVIPHLYEAYNLIPNGELKDKVRDALATALESASASLRK